MQFKISNIKFKMRIIIYGNLHHKNKNGLELVSKEIQVLFLNSLEGIEKYDDGETILLITNNIYQVNFSKVIYGPQIDLRDIIKKSKENIKVNVLSKWISNICYDFVTDNKVNFLNIPFPVDINKFKPKEDKENKCFIYYKNVERYKLELAEKLIKDYNIDYKVFLYGSYNEEEYLNYISKCKFGIWVGCHESQGFALEEALSCNCPLFILNVTSMKDEFNGSFPWRDTSISFHNLTATSAQYFDNTCGVISNFQTYKEDFILFLKNLDQYQPRNYVIENLGVTQFINKLKEEFNLSTPNHTP
jgi:hypothetical protein